MCLNMQYERNPKRSDACFQDRTELSFKTFNFTSFSFSQICSSLSKNELSIRVEDLDEPDEGLN